MTDDNRQPPSSRYDLDQVRVTGQHMAVSPRVMEMLLGKRPKPTRWRRLIRWLQRRAA